jgi:hypothetical protein
LKVAAVQGLLAGPSSSSQGEGLLLCDLFVPLLDLGRGSPARRIRRLGRRVGVGDMVPGGNPWSALLSTTRTTLLAPFPFSEALLRYLLLLTTTPLLGRNPLVPLTDDGGVETSLSFLKASSWVLQRCWSNSGSWRWPWRLRSLLFVASSSDSFGPMLRLCLWRWCSRCSPLGVSGGCPRRFCSLLHCVLGGTTLRPNGTASSDPGRGTSFSEAKSMEF